QAVCGPDDDFVLEQRLLWAEQGQLDEGMPFFLARLRENHPAAPLIAEAVARGLIRAFRLPEAKDWTDRWVARQPDNSEAYLLRGTVLEMFQRSGEAVENFRKTL